LNPYAGIYTTYHIDGHFIPRSVWACEILVSYHSTIRHHNPFKTSIWN